MRFTSAGDWTFAGHLHDFSTFTGDNYALAFVFNFTDGTAHGPVATGELGSSLTSVPEDNTIGLSGNDPWVAKTGRRHSPAAGSSASTLQMTLPPLSATSGMILRHSWVMWGSHSAAESLALRIQKRASPDAHPLPEPDGEPAGGNGG